jgi:hypothetical protein
MKKNLSVAGNIFSIIALVGFIAYAGLNAFYDINSIYQADNIAMIKEFRDLTILPGFISGGLGLLISGIYVSKFSDELSTVEKAIPLSLPAISLIALSVFVFVL